MKMNLKQFYQKVKDVLLFPGTLDELNRQEEINKSGRVYDLVKDTQSARYVRGLLVPGWSETEAFMRSMLMVAVEANMDEFEREEYNPQETESELEELIGPLKEIFDKVRCSPYMLKHDIRLKAREMKANGIIHFKYECENSVDLKDNAISSIKYNFYTGVPVRLIGKRG
jgi:hypothetical protein